MCLVRDSYPINLRNFPLTLSCEFDVDSNNEDDDDDKNSHYILKTTMRVVRRTITHGVVWANRWA